MAPNGTEISWDRFRKSKSYWISEMWTIQPESPGVKTHETEFLSKKCSKIWANLMEVVEKKHSPIHCWQFLDTEVNELFIVSCHISYMFFNTALFFWVEWVTQVGSLLKYLLMVDLEGNGCCPATSWTTLNKLKPFSFYNKTGVEQCSSISICTLTTIHDKRPWHAWIR